MVQKHFWSCGKPVYCHQPTQPTATSPSRHTACTPTRQDGSTLRNSSFFPPSSAPPAPLLLAQRKRLSSRATLATQPGVEPPHRVPHLLLGLVRAKWCPLFTSMHLLCGEGLHTHEGPGLSTSAGWVREGTALGSAQDSRRELPPRQSLTSPPGHKQHWWRTVIFTQLLFSVHIHLKKTKISPIHHPQTIPQAFTTLPGDAWFVHPPHVASFKEQRCLHGRFLSQRVSFHKQLSSYVRSYQPSLHWQSQN